MPKVDVICRQCGVSVKVSPYQVKESNFCSRDCFNVWRKGSRVEQLTCEYCGVQFERKRSNARGKHHFCGKDCRYAWDRLNRDVTGENNPNWKERVRLECAHCGGSFERLECNIKEGSQYCSKSCSDEAKKLIIGESHPLFRRVSVSCEWCGAQFEVVPNRSDARFCGQECNTKWLNHLRSTKFVGKNHHNWRGGSASYRGSNWPKQSARARSRDKHTCQRCGLVWDGKGKAFSVHHKIPFRLFGVERYREANRLKNLETLCKSCHSIIEREYQKTGGEYELT